MEQGKVEKKSNSYYLDVDVINWIERQGKSMERGSASYFLNKVARQAMNSQDQAAQRHRLAAELRPGRPDR